MIECLIITSYLTLTQCKPPVKHEYLYFIYSREKRAEKSPPKTHLNWRRACTPHNIRKPNLGSYCCVARTSLSPTVLIQQFHYHQTFMSRLHSTYQVQSLYILLFSFFPPKLHAGRLRLLLVIRITNA